MLRLLLITTLLATFTACATNPVTGKRQLSLISQQQELAMGKQLYGNSIQQQGGQYYLDDKANDYISRIGNKLAALSHQPSLPYEFTIINSSVPNAWALPGGKIAINRGLLTMLDDEAQLAAVLGHEIVHVTARHGAQQQTTGVLIGLGTAIAQAAAGEMAGVVSDSLNLGGQMVMAKYGRDDELQADLYGTRYISAAGYDPKAASELQHKLMRLKDSQDNAPLAVLFASHPPSQERMQRNQQIASKLTGQLRNRQQFQQQLATMFADYPAYQHYDQAEKLYRDKAYDKALNELNKALKIQPEESSFWLLKAQLLTHKNQRTAAHQAYNKAIQYNPDYFRGYLMRGISSYQRGNHNSAQQDFNKADTLLKTRLSSFYQGEIAFDQQQYQSAIQYYQPVAQGSDELAIKAREKLTKIQTLQ